MGLRWMTAGEAHGEGYVVILEGIPSGLKISEEEIDLGLRRRRVPYGRGPRMRERMDSAKILAGVIGGETIGSPLGLYVGESGGVHGGKEVEEFTVPRPGHADLAGAFKYGTTRLNRIWERASARETAGRVAAGAVCRKLLEELGVRVDSFTLAIGGVRYEPQPELAPPIEMLEGGARCPDPAVDASMQAAIDEASARGDSLGGRCRVLGTGMPAGVGSFAQWDLRLDARIAAAMMSIPSVKGVLIGEAERGVESYGSEYLDQIRLENGRPSPAGNCAGGIEGGLTTGRSIVVDLLVKPIPTLGKPLDSIDLRTGKKASAPALRADICVVPAVGVIAEAMLALELSRALLEQFGGDTMEELGSRVKSHRNRMTGFPR
jgi:chorismate synthase